MVSSGPFRAIRFSYPEPFKGIGFWGKQTSTLNWCEEASAIPIDMAHANSSLTCRRIMF